MDFIIAKDGHKLYKALCMSCGIDIGYKRKHLLVGNCSSCSAINRVKRIGNPMKGKIHNNKDKFRKNTYSNVNYDDIKIEYSKSGNKRIKYLQSCPQCNVSIGYRVHIDATRVCKSCRNKNVTCYTPEQRRIRTSMKASISSRLKNRLLSKNKKSTFDLLGYTVDELKTHLESKFQEGMTWDNYGEWEIDHIIPDSWFEYSSTGDEGFKKSWSLDNLQPLWKADNASKSNRYEG